MSQGKVYDNLDMLGLLRKVNPVVDKSGPVCPNTVFLPKEKPFSFGRSSSGVCAQLLSRKTPLMISRKHATIIFKDGQWMITDHESLNGVFVNGIKVKANDPYPLVCGDKVAFGIAVGSSKSPEFEYVFQEIPHDYKLKRPRENVSNDIDPVVESKRKCESDVYVKREKVERDGKSACDEQIKIQENRIKELTDALASKEKAHNDLAITLEKKEQDLTEKLEKQREELENEKLEAERKLQLLLEQQLREKENMLKENFEEKIKSLESERDIIEKSLQKELNDKLTEKDETYKEELEKQKEALNRILSEMQMERNNREAEMRKNQELINNLKNAEENEKQLGACLEELRRQILEKDQDLHRQTEITKKAEEDGKRLVLQQMEDEFTCMICHELFVHAVTLTCAHSFCEICLRSWMKKKKECPVCRGRITGRAVKSVVLDSAISKMIENADNETKQNRKRLVSQRIALREAEQGFRSLPYEAIFESASNTLKVVSSVIVKVFTRSKTKSLLKGLMNNVRFSKERYNSKAKGFEKLLVTDGEESQTESGSNNQGHLRDWNGRPGNQEFFHYNNFVPGAQTHEVFSNRYTFVNSSGLGQLQMGHGSNAHGNRAYGDDQRANTANRNGQRVEHNRDRDGRRPPNDGRRNGSQSHQPSRGWNGNCFICGNRGHYARHCYLNNNNSR